MTLLEWLLLIGTAVTIVILGISCGSNKEVFETRQGQQVCIGEHKYTYIAPCAFFDCHEVIVQNGIPKTIWNAEFQECD